ncbi:MAG: RNA polymerase sigma factor [Acidobacteriota bacterium]
MARPRLEDLFDAHHARLFRLARRMLRDVQESQDAVQETFLRAARNLERLPPGEEGAEAWLVRVLVNFCRDRYRRQKVRGFSAELSGDEVATGSRPDDAVVAKRTVQVALAALPPRRRAVVVLHELEGRDTREIAELLGLAQVTVRWHLAAGRAQLAKLLLANSSVFGETIR